MAQPKKKTELSQLEKKQRSQQRMMENIDKKERILKWAAIGLLILLLLLFLFVGYATDWMKGVHKDSAVGTTTTPIQGSLDSAKGTTTGTDTPATDASGTSTTRTNSGTNTQTNNNTGTTAKETNTTNTNTSRTDTVTNNNTTTTTPAAAQKGILSLYANSSVGDDISQLLDSSQLLGVSKSCRNEILIQICEFTQDDLLITTKNLLGTGLITSITKNF